MDDKLGDRGPSRREVATASVAGGMAVALAAAAQPAAAAPAPAPPLRREGPVRRSAGPAFTYLKDYQNLYENIRVERDARGVLTITLHTDGGAPTYGNSVKNQLLDLFWNVGADPDNQVVIYTAAGDSLFGGRPPGGGTGGQTREETDQAFPFTAWNTKHALENLLDIECPMIAAIPGPTRIHAEYGLLCDIVLASTTFVVQDEPHFLHGLVPGDGVHIVWPMLLGPSRARYFMFTGQEIGAEEALRLGLVHEVMPRERLLARANELAGEILRRPPGTRRLTRIVHTLPIKRAVAADMAHGIWLEGFAWGDQAMTPGPRGFRSFAAGQ
jgi:enoyl-CoA hydratase/carnithine racemase